MTPKINKFTKEDWQDLGNKVSAVVRGRWNDVFVKSAKKTKEQYFVYESEDDLKGFGYLGHLTLWVTLIFIFIMIVWAKFAILEEVTVAQGQIIPSSKTQIVQNLEGGIVEQIFVKEGDVVNRGQILFRMSGVRFTSAYREGKSKEAAMLIKIARLEADVNNTTFKIAPELVKDFPELVRSEQELYSSRQTELDLLKSMRASLLQEIKMNEPLVKDGTISPVELLHLKQRLNEVDSNISKFRSASLQELNYARAEFSRLQENNVSLQDQMARTAVRSPVRGIVKQIYVYTVGGVVNPGSPLAEVVPLDDTLLVEAHVRPQDIGFLRPGQESMVKITAYDFSIYGGLKGKVEHISADTQTDPKGNSYYETWVRTDRNYLEKKGKKMQIIPGMQASVDFLTGYKSVADYILKPILKARQTALRER